MSGQPGDSGAVDRSKCLSDVCPVGGGEGDAVQGGFSKHKTTSEVQPFCEKESRLVCHVDCHGAWMQPHNAEQDIVC